MSLKSKIGKVLNMHDTFILSLEMASVVFPVFSLKSFLEQYIFEYCFNAVRYAFKGEYN